jgi:HK97 family phage major capsid protein
MTDLTRDERYQRVGQLQQFILDQRAEFEGQQMPSEAAKRIRNAEEELTRHTAVLDQLEARDQDWREGVMSGKYAVEGADGFHRVGQTVDSKTGWRRGEPPPLLTRGQNVADWVRSQRPSSDQRSDQQPMRFAKIARGLATGNWDDAELEQRAIAESPATAGGHMIPVPVASTVIDKARNASRVVEAGALSIPMSSATLKYPRLTTDAPASWRNEAASITDQALVFDAVTFTAQSLAVLVKVSWELFEDTDPSSMDVVENSFARVLGLELDRAALRGTGTPPEPRGIVNQTGVTITTHGANGTVISNYDWWLDAAGAVLASNFTPNAHIVAPRSVTSLAKLKEATTNAYLDPPSSLLPLLPTKQVPINLTVGTSTDCSEIYTGQWNQCWIGLRTGFSLRFLQERFADTGQYAFLASLRADVQLAQPAAFVVDTGIRT